MKFKNHKGSVTVFTSIVLSAVLLAAAVFTDAARISLAHSHINRAGSTAVSSVLACYSNQLEKEYGLFGVYQDDASIKESFEEYLAKNLNIYEKEEFLYDFNIENTSIKQQHTLEDRAIFERQIMEFMKYRAPYEIAADLVKKAEGLGSLTGNSKVYKGIIEADKKASEIGKIQLYLENTVKKINGIGITSKLSELKKALMNKETYFNEYISQKYAMQEQISNETGINKKGELIKKLKDIEDNINEIVKSKEEVEQQILELIKLYESLNSEALENSNTITVKKGELIKRIQEEINNIQKADEGSHEIQQYYENDLEHILGLMGEDNSDAIIASLNRNIERCKYILKKAALGNDFLQELDSFSEAGINYTFNKTVPSISEDEDNRGKVEQALKRLFSEKAESIKIEDNLMKQLPSRKANIEEKTVTEVNSYGINSGGEISIDGYLDDLLSDDSIAAASESQLVSRVTEAIYVNEYVMGTFMHDVPLLKNEEQSRAYNLRSEDKTKRKGYFSEFEVEYIINGNRDEGVNSLLMKSEIMALRLTANAVHIYGNPIKMSRIASLAASLSIWSAGLSAPLIQTTILFAWAAAESIYDINQLLSGEKVPIYKTKDQWKTDISGAVSENTKAGSEDSFLCLSYQDYLKVFLLMMNKEKKLARIQDLIQLNLGRSNTGFLLEDCKAELKMDMTVSIKNIFIFFSSFNQKSELKTSRTYISEDMCIGY
ncbi:hypothetical protein LY28_01368 [Ruminiclostridium sufflavum DSM 19573]|uniref:Uncharacterized protein n=1 Tax=Ruminiclostridium sufflavum DSM 19573 TaxID=1121337 RepID=A0A318XNJ6_9FIRM|nr:DUF5702 domain-containing protein [Ruminiclostridium sufflavum]PYG88519.1 hypothetical protein LY28_01368 [Ruminiclostridium sufflavum DSM 19573]